MTEELDASPARAGSSVAGAPPRTRAVPSLAAGAVAAHADATSTTRAARDRARAGWDRPRIGRKYRGEGRDHPSAAAPALQVAGRKRGLTGPHRRGNDVCTERPLLSIT